MNRPNIVFIILDTLRADKVLTSHNNIYLTPFIRNLLKKSVYFENCIANSPWTLPSHISMFTGLYPSQNALISENMERLSNKFPILAEILRNIGYNTECFTENAFISKYYGLTRGFNKIHSVWDWNPWIRVKFKLSIFIKILNKFELKTEKLSKFKKIRVIWKHVYKIALNIIKWISKFVLFENILYELKNNTLNDLSNFFQIIKRNNINNPFFLFFNFLTVHDPYIPLKKTYQTLNISTKDFKNIKDLIINPLKTRLDVNIKSNRLSNKQIKTIKKLYCGCVLSSDIILKFLFSNFEKFGLLKNTYFIIASDHGEHLGSKLDHNFWEHNTYQSVFDSLLKVPLLIYNEKYTAKIIKKQVQLKDLFHTILHLIGDSQSNTNYLNLEKSILNQIETDSTPKYIFGEYINPKKAMFELINSNIKSINKQLISKIFNHVYFIRTNNYKYIRYNNINVEEFYDLTNDPYEQNNLIDVLKIECERFRKKMDFFLKKINNIDKIRELITEKEKENVKSLISRLKISGI